MNQQRKSEKNQTGFQTQIIYTNSQIHIFHHAYINELPSFYIQNYKINVLIYRCYIAEIFDITDISILNTCIMS